MGAGVATGPHCVAAPCGSPRGLAVALPSQGLRHGGETFSGPRAIVHLAGSVVRFARVWRGSGLRPRRSTLARRSAVPDLPFGNPSHAFAYPEWPPAWLITV